MATHENNKRHFLEASRLVIERGGNGHAVGLTGNCESIKWKGLPWRDKSYDHSWGCFFLCYVALSEREKNKP